MAKDSTHKRSFIGIHKLKAVVILLSMFVVSLSGMLARVSLTTMLVRCTLVFVVVVAISRVIIQILKTNEEMTGG
ncbi:hypothetical protein EBR25_01310 [bacterium]|nr:hypothetical protein [bacterium]